MEVPVSPEPEQLPRLKESVDATAKELLLVSIHETRRMREAGTPVALEREQRMSVMLASARKLFWAS